MSDDADPELPEATVVSANALLEALIPQLQTTPIEIVKPSRDSRVGMQLQPLGALVVVDNRADDGLAAAAGICAGDVVISINGERVTDHDQGASLVIASEGVVRLEIIRPGAAAAAEGAGAADGAIERQTSLTNKEPKQPQTEGAFGPQSDKSHPLRATKITYQ